MLSRVHLGFFVVASLAVAALAQNPPREDIAGEDTAGGSWRTVQAGEEQRFDRYRRGGDEAEVRLAQAPSGASARPSARPSARQSAPSRMAPAGNLLSSQHGQIWQEYDIRPYTLRVTSTSRPEATVVDWVLRETGYEVWHSEPMGVLSASRDSLKVYHTPDMQRIVAGVVERFTSPEAESHSFSLRVVTIDDPNWRTRAHRILTPVPVQTQGVQAWLLRREEAAMLVAEMSKRSDYREHSSPHALVGNGDTHVITETRPRSFMQNLVPRPESWPGFEAQPGQIEEGLALEFSPLLSADGASIDAVLKLYIDQVEQFRSVMIDVPSPVAPSQRAQVEIPQISQFRIQERFRWPVDQVLLVGLGMTPSPHPPTQVNPLPVSLPLGLTQNGPPRSDLLVFIESKDTRGREEPGAKSAQRVRVNAHGRY